MLGRIMQAVSKVSGGVIGLTTGLALGPFAAIGNYFAWINSRRFRDVEEAVVIAPLLIMTGLMYLPFAVVGGLIYGAIRGAYLGVKLGLQKSFLGVPKELFTYDARHNSRTEDRAILLSYRKFDVEKSKTFVFKAEEYYAKDKSKALKYLTHAIRLNKHEVDLYVGPIKIRDQANLYFERAQIYAERKQHDLVIQDCNAAIRLNSKRAEVYYLRGSVRLQKRERKLAMNDLLKTIALNPQHADAYNDLGMIHFQQREFDRALKYFNQAIVINNQCHQFYINRGNVYFLQGELDAALVDFTSALQLNPACYATYHARGLVYYQQNQLPHAMNDFNRALELNPDYEDANLHREIAYRHQQAILQLQMSQSVSQPAPVISTKTHSNDNPIHALQKMLDQTSLWSYPARRKAFNELSQLATKQKNVDAMCALADTYLQGKAPGIQFNQSAAAKAYYQQLEENHCPYGQLYGQWMRLKMEADDAPRSKKMVHEALLAAFQFICHNEKSVLKEAQDQKAVEYILARANDTKIVQKQRYFAQILAATVKPNDATKRQRDAALAALSVGERKSIYHEISVVLSAFECNGDTQKEAQMTVQRKRKKVRAIESSAPPLSLATPVSVDEEKREYQTPPVEVDVTNSSYFRLGEQAALPKSPFYTADHSSYLTLFQQPQREEAEESASHREHNAPLLSQTSHVDNEAETASDAERISQWGMLPAPPTEDPENDVIDEVKVEIKRKPIPKIALHG